MRQTAALLLAVAISASLAVGGCTHTVSRDISAQGVAGQVVFPELNHAWLKEGTFPNLDNLRSVKSGVTKDQLYNLLGRPHFREGLYGVREWDYIFHFRQSEGIKTCQFKVIFDNDMLARSFHWLPAECVGVLAAAPARAS